jgi:hypothetical protein
VFCEYGFDAFCSVENWDDVFTLCWWRCCCNWNMILKELGTICYINSVLWDALDLVAVHYWFLEIDFLLFGKILLK